MIGSEKVTLAEVPPREMTTVLGIVAREPDADLWFGSGRQLSKGSFSGATNARPGIGVLLILVAFFLLIDAAGDPTEFTTWSGTWLGVLLISVIGLAIVAFVGSEVVPDGWSRYCFLARLGDRETIGVGEIWRDERNGVCSIFVAILKTYRGRKLGSVVGRLLIRRSFEYLNARLVESSALGTNVAGIEMNDGMIEDGVLRKRWLIRGREVDERVYRLTRDEWKDQIARREAKATGG